MVVNIWIMIGLVASAFARIMVPGGNPIRLVLTSGMGIAGAVLGGLIASAVWPVPERQSLPPAEPVECVVIPTSWELIETAIWPAAEEGPGASDLWPGWLTAIGSAAVALRAYFAVARRRPAPPGRSRQRSRRGPSAIRT